MGEQEQSFPDHPMGDPDTVCSVFEQAPAIMVALDGPRLTLAAANTAYRLAYPKLKLGASAWDTFPEIADQQLYEMYTRVYETGQAVEAREWRIQTDVDGSGVREIFFDLLVTPRQADDGTVLGVQIIGQDVTERVRIRQAAEARARTLQDRYETVRDSAALMQRALLAPVVPVLPGADIAAAYLVATEDTAAGGDWFDVITDRRSDDLYLVVGDVVGHGVEAAAVMAQLRTAVRMQLRAGVGVVEALSTVDDFATEIPGATGATLCVLRLDPNTGEVQYCTAGHPPPLIVTADGSSTYLQPSGARPLGARHPFTTATAHLDHDDVALVYTDGIIERPGLRLPASTAEVAEVARRILHGKFGYPLDRQHAPVQRLCGQAIEMLLRETGYSDDITLLALQRRPTPPALHLDLPADKHAEPAVRGRLRAWFNDLGADFVSGQILEHAVTEFVANAVEHAYRSTTPGQVTIAGTLGNDGRARVTVTDHGTWRPTTLDDTRGRGLSIAQALVPDTTVDRTDTGTTVTAVHLLSRAAHIVTDPHTTQTIPAAPQTVPDIAVDDDGLIIVSGDLDTSGAAHLAGVLATRSRAGTTPVTVDLSAVTHLGSAAVSVLTQADRRADTHHNTCTLIAPPGSTAHHVLSLAGLPTKQPSSGDWDTRPSG